jgi:hypothetical protein
MRGDDFAAEEIRDIDGIASFFCVTDESQLWIGEGRSGKLRVEVYRGI